MIKLLPLNFSNSCNFLYLLLLLILIFPSFFKNTINWEQRALGEVFAKAGSGGTPSTSIDKYYNGNIPFLSIADLHGRLIKTTQKTITEEGLLHSTAWIVPQGSIALAMYASVGKVGILSRPMATSQAFYNMVFTNDSTRNFIFTYLEEMDLQRKWEGLVSTGTQRNLNAGKIQNLVIQIPERNEQKQISHFFQTLDSLIAAAERKVLLLKKKKHAYLNHIFTQHLRFTGHTTPWQTKKLGDISDIQTGSSDVQDAIPDGLYPFFVRSEVILRSNRYLYDGESILIPGEGRIGEVIHYYKGKFDYHQRVYKISDFVNRIVPKFIFFSMQYSFKKHALRHTVKATVDSLRLPTISSYTVNLSEESEQIKIVHFFQILDSLITATERKVNLLKKKKQAYLQKMFI